MCPPFVIIIPMKRTLRKIYKEDQMDRTMDGDWNTISRRDKTRRAEVKKILSTKKRLSSEELYYAAMIFHHSGARVGTKKALTLAKLSMQAGNRGGKFTTWGEKAKWLVASATDRLLLMGGKSQKYGTQYRRKSIRSPLELARYDKKTTDAERKEFNVPPLEQILEEIAKLNRSEK